MIVHFGHIDHEYLSVEFLGRSNPTTTDFWDANWLNVQVLLAVGRFNGEFKGSLKNQLRTTDLAAFRMELSALYQSLSGNATLKTVEDWLQLTLTGDGKGHLLMNGRVLDGPGIGNTLTLQLELDQTFLPEIIRSLDAVLVAYPIIGKP